jgi:hypothetical protein
MRVTATARFATWNSLRWWAADGEERRAGAAVHHLEAQQAPPKFQRPQDVRQLEVDVADARVGMDGAHGRILRRRRNARPSRLRMNAITACGC